MMLKPTEYELMHLYDPIKAHAYYEKHKKLKGREPAKVVAKVGFTGKTVDPRKGKTREEISKNARTKQREELRDQINSLSAKLTLLNALIRKKSHDEASDDRKSKAKKERSAKEKDKPKTAAEKAEAARDSEKYRDKHKQELKTKAKDDKSKSGSSSKSETAAESSSVSELKSLATKVKGQIAVAKQKLAAL